MGQRNATYVIVESERGTSVLPIYNQWNYIKLQSHKLVRGIKAVKSFNFHGGDGIREIPYIYFINAGTYKMEGKNCWVGGYTEMELYNNKTYTGPFQEHNNNGWNIVKFKINKHENLSSIELFCVPGSSDESQIKGNKFEDYFYENNKKEIKYLKRHCKWNPHLVEEVKKLLTYDEKEFIGCQ